MKTPKAPSEAKTRTLHFSAERSLGSIRYGLPEGGERGGPIPAQGDVQLPAAAEVNLNLDVEAANELDSLRNLGPNDLKSVGGSVPEGVLEAISHLSGLKALSGLSDLTDAGFAHLSKLVNLEMMHATCPEVTSVGVASLSKLPKLKDLFFFLSQIDDGALKSIAKGFPALQNLTFTRSGVTNGGLADLHEARPALSINNRKGDSERVAWLRARATELVNPVKPAKTITFPDDSSGKLDIYVMDEGRMEEKEARGVVNVPAGAYVALTLTDPSGTRALEVLQVDDLQGLTLEGEWVDDEVMASIAHLKDLGTLEIHGAVTDIGISCLRDFESLGRLTVDSAAVTEKGLAALTNLPNLQSADFAGTAVGDEAVGLLTKGFPSLAAFSGGPTFGPKGILSLLEAKPDFRINGSKFMPAGIAKMKKRLASV